MCRPGRGLGADDLGLHCAPPTCGDAHQFARFCVGTGASHEFRSGRAAAGDGRGITPNAIDATDATDVHLNRAESHLSRAAPDCQSGAPGWSDSGPSLRGHQPRALHPRPVDLDGEQGLRLCRRERQRAL